MKYPLLTPRAQGDLAEIWSYSAERWGEERSEAYIRRIQSAIAAIAEDHRCGQPCDDIRRGYFRYRVESHVVFYRIAKPRIVAVRILHARMDFGRHV